jgi:hypothetical protein
MSDTYEINERNEVVPYTAGRRCNDTRLWRDATEMELQQRESIVQLERELASVTEQRDRLAEAVESFLSQQVAPLVPLRQALAAVKGGTQ